jgi:uncharacterized membrane-anchored protein YhcB (DUF1043 family)
MSPGGTIVAGIELGRYVAMTSHESSERKPVAKLVQDAIDKGATTVEEIHKSIADLPLRILEESDLLKEPAKEVRRVQDHTIGAIYDLIREINQQVGTLASTLLAEAAERKGARAEASAKHHAGRHSS